MTLRILVPVKRVVDANVRVRVSARGAIDTTGLKMSLNPFDECALEKALQLQPNMPLAHLNLGMILAQTEELLSAAKHLDFAIAKLGASPDAHGR